jgi:hypothetical protein
VPRRCYLDRGNSKAAHGTARAGLVVVLSRCRSLKWSGKFGQRARLDELALWLQAQLRKISGKAKLAEAIRYALNRMPKARGYLEDGRLELDNNTCERVNGRVKVSQRAAQNVATLGLG